MALAQHVPLDIISVDSALVYRGMDIGTAKPTPAERAAVPHHLIDILDPADAYSAARFIADATRLCAEIRGRGRLPLLVGGTMLYFKALRDGLDTLPGADPVVRAAIDARAAALGWPALHAELARVDPATAARLAPGDAQRIQRALEVWQVSGQPLSFLQQGRARRRPEGQHAAAQRAQVWPIVSLEPADRAWLHTRIAQRFDAMLAAGLVDEVRALRARGDLQPEMPAMRCVGYRQVWQALDRGDADIAASARDAGIAATRQLAKRQLTWLRGMPDRHIVRCDSADAMQRGMELLKREWHRSC